MEFSSRLKDDTSGNSRLGFLEEKEETDDQNSTKFILVESSKVDLDESTDVEGAKIHRTRFTAYQKMGLEEAFSSSQYVRSYDCQILAARLGLTTKTVQVWFRNKRFKMRKNARQERQRPRHQSSSSSSSIDGGKFSQDVYLQQAIQSQAGMTRTVSSPSYMYMDSRVPPILHSPPPFLIANDYLIPACCSPSLTSMQSPFRNHRHHPYL